MTDIFEKFNSLNVLIIGDVMIDSYVWGQIDRMSPEAPVPVVRVTKKENRLGGAANVALNVQSLGANPIMCAIIGDDSEGSDLLALMENAQLSKTGIIPLKGRPTTVKTRIIAHNKHIIRVDAETDENITAQETALMQQTIARIIDAQKVDAIIFEDYDKGLISSELIAFTVDLANRKNIITVVDPKKRNFLDYRKVTLFKPNLKELREGLETEIDPTNTASIDQAVDAIKAKLSARNIMLTLSEHGVYVRTSEGKKLIPAHARAIADVSGAGDTVVATAALCLAAGLDEYTTAAISNLAGGLVCEHVGVVPIDKERLLAESRKLGI